MRKKEINKGAQAALLINEKIQAMRKSPLSEHKQAMDKLKQIQKSAPPAGSIPIYDEHGKIVG